MMTEKLQEIIDQKNGDLERAAVAHARKLIDQIAHERGQIDTSTKRIAELQNELRQLQVQQIDAASILN